MDTKSSFTHIDKKGHVRMVDVTDKKPSERRLQELRELWQRKKLRILFPCVTR
jgi:molybdenum cofactor biosynthesis enzyme